MTPELVVNFAKEAIILTIFLSMPMLMLGLIVGFIIAIFQAVTQVQEMTLMFVPKIVAVFMGLLLASPWMLDEIVSFTRRIIENIPMYIK